MHNKTFKLLVANSCAEEKTDVSQVSVLGKVLRKGNIHILRNQEGEI